MFSLLFLAHARCHRPARWQRAARAAPLLLLGAAPASIDACTLTRRTPSPVLPLCKVLYREGARADTMYVLLSGTLEHSSGSYQVLEANP